MAVLLSAKDVCERALRMVGAFAINDSAAQPEDLLEALHWLDMGLSQLTGTAVIRALVPATLSVPLSTADQKSYDLSDALTTNFPSDGVAFPIEAWLQDDSNNRYPLEIVTRQRFEDVSKVTQAGTPDYVYFDRLLNMQLSVWPVPSVTTWTVELVAQTFSPDIAENNPVKKAGTGFVAHGLRQSWQRWAVLQLAADIGDGPVRTVAASKVASWQAKAEEALVALRAFDNTEHETTPPINDSWDYG